MSREWLLSFQLACKFGLGRSQLDSAVLSAARFVSKCRGAKAWACRVVDQRVDVEEVILVRVVWVEWGVRLIAAKKCGEEGTWWLNAVVATGRGEMRSIKNENEDEDGQLGQVGQCRSQEQETKSNSSRDRCQDNISELRRHDDDA